MKITRASPRALRTSLPIALAALCWSAANVSAQTGSIRGRVLDQDGAAVYTAVVELRAEGEDGPAIRVSETDRLGAFYFTELAPGRYGLSAGRVGFATEVVPVTVTAGRTEEVIVGLEPRAIELEGIDVQAERSRERARFEEQAGSTVRDLAGEEIKLIPGLAEADPLRAIEVLPGVVSTSDFSSAFNVRGGSADQNLILVDGMPIFNPFHLGGLFSVFNADMVGRAELFAGGFPAEFGGRVSSVLDVETDAGTGRRQIDLGVSLLATRASIGGGLPESWQSALGLTTARWRVGGRRSYFDVLFAPVFDFPYHLNDLQAVFEGWTPGGGRITVSGYTGDDVLRLTELPDDEAPLQVDWTWGNDVLGLAWAHPTAGGGRTELRTSFSRFDTDLRFPDFSDVRFRSRIDLWSTAFKLEHRITPRWRLKSGLSADRYSYDNLAVSGGTEFRGGLGSGWLLAGFAQGSWSAWNRWLLEVGARVDAWWPDPGDRVVEVSPRLAVKRFLGSGDWALKASAGRFTQFLHSVRDEELPIGLDIWVLAGDRAPPVVSDQVQVGLEGYPTEDWFVSLEAYLRGFDGVITPNFADDPNEALDDLLPGEGYSYGADFFVRRSGEGTTGWLSVSLLKTERTFPDFISGLDPAPEITYPPIFDRRVDVDLVVRRKLGWGVEAGLRWNFGSGIPFTRPRGNFASYSKGLLARDFFWDTEGFEYSVVLGDRNAARYPAYHRLDLSFRRPSRKSWGTITPYLDVLNAYNRKNVLFYAFDYENDPPTRSGVSMFPVLPTLGVEISF